MRICSSCQRPVPDVAAMCPHAGCGKPLKPLSKTLSPAAPKRPPGIVQVSRPASTSPPQPVVSKIAAPLPLPLNPAKPPADAALSELTVATDKSSRPAAQSRSSLSTPARIRPPPPGPVQSATDRPVPAVALSSPRRGQGWLAVCLVAAASVIGVAAWLVLRHCGDSSRDQLASVSGAARTGAAGNSAAGNGFGGKGQAGGGGPTNDIAKIDAANKRISSDDKDDKSVQGHGEAKSDTPKPGPATSGEAITSAAKPNQERQYIVSGIYSLRTAPHREAVIAAYGGTTESEKAVGEGLAWLARHQGVEGDWSSACLGRGPQSRCEQGVTPCDGQGQPFEAAQTGLGLLAFQAGGNYHFNGHMYSENVRRGLDWLVDHQDDEGALVGSQNKRRGGFAGQYGATFMYEHGMATFALSEACALETAAGRHPNEKYFAAAEKAVRFIERQQHSDGGWRYTTNRAERSDTSVSGWQVLALKSAREAGIHIDDQTVAHVTEFFETCENPSTGRTGYTNAAQAMTEATTGVGMLVHEFLLKEPDAPLVKKASEFLADMAEQRWAKQQPNASPVRTRERLLGQNDVDYYLWYNCTLAMFQAGGKPWDRWNGLVRGRVIAEQDHGDGCIRGSWPANDGRYGREGGRIYTTALAVLTLEVYYRFAKQEHGIK